MLKKVYFKNGIGFLEINNNGGIIDNIICTTTKDIIDEEDTHYFRSDCKRIKKDSEVKLERYCENLYGTYLYVSYEEETYCVRPLDLRVKQKIE